MEMSFVIENDSGYVSRHQESNLDSSCENVCLDKGIKYPDHELYLSEDALLEEPSHTENRIESFESVINSSQDSVKTEFSGFECSDQSDVSYIIPEVSTIMWNANGWKEAYCNNVSDDIEENVLNCSKSSFNICSSDPHLDLTNTNVHDSNRRQHKILANVTNIHETTMNYSLMKNMLQDENKENIDPSATPKKQYGKRPSLDVSPDLFPEEAGHSDEKEASSKNVIPIRLKSPTKKKNSHSSDIDVKLLKKVQNRLGGVYPPPSLTTIRMNVTEMLNKLEDNRYLFWSSIEGETSKLFSERTKEQLDIVTTEWPKIMGLRHHGLHYNRNNICEEFEHLCSRYAERYVGAETQSTCTVFESNESNSIRRKLAKPKWMAKSPGKRLSHLARRRITFSNSSLQGSSASCVGSRTRQILVDAKKMTTLQKRTPKKTPSKSPFKIKRNTPSSSAKKKLALKFREMTGEFENENNSTYSFDRFSSKTLLVTSPKENSNPGMSGVLAAKKSTKRALFSSPLKRSSPNKSPLTFGKRKRNNTDEDNPSKFFRTMSCDLKPSDSVSKSSLNRTLSDSNLRFKNEELSEQHKKKLQWAVYESLRLQNITASHPQYKVYASVLARVTRRFLQGVSQEARTSDKMFRIARYHSYAVVKGKTVDDIVREYLKQKLKNKKPQGYMGIQEFQGLNDSFDDKENVLRNKANIIESIEKRREHAGSKSKFLNDNRIDQIKKVISFEENV